MSFVRRFCALALLGSGFPGSHGVVGVLGAEGADSRVVAPAFSGLKAGDQRELAGIQLCWCPAGKFMMGSPRGEPERRPDEDQVEVTLTKGFWMAKYETTQGQWKQVWGKLPGELTAQLPAGDDFPVGNVNFAEANIIPASPGAGLYWDLSTLLNDGTLRVGPAATRTNIVASVAGNQLNLSWPTNYVGWVLQGQTNAPGGGLTNVWYDVPGSDTTNLIVVPIDVSQGSAFYRLILR